jgi:phosphonate transport system permease protein
LSSRAPFRTTLAARLGAVGLVAYAIYACFALEITGDRLLIGIENGARFVARMFPPVVQDWQNLTRGLVESLEIAALASALGILIALPIGLLAARNLMPPWASWPARLVIALCRSFHPVILAILFVKAVGFGALAGILALAVASVGFVGKLFAEGIEEISPRQVEAVRATGAPFMGVVAFGILPQVFSRFVGFSTYQVDANLRNSTMVGIVGAGGIGGALFAAFQRFDFDYVCAIAIAIIGIIMVGEALANQVRAIFVDNLALGELIRRRLTGERGPRMPEGAGGP